MVQGSSPQGREAGHVEAQPGQSGYREGMFLLFSNRLGCLGSLLLSVLVTIVLIAVLNGR